MFEFDLTDEFRKSLDKLSRKNLVLSKSVNKKIKEIISRDKKEIRSYKNLRHSLKNLKRVHITEWLVMTFEVLIDENLIIFRGLKPRSKVYKR